MVNTTTPCPTCDGRKWREATRCLRCYQASRPTPKPKHTYVACPDCGGPMAVTSAHCWRCAPAHMGTGKDHVIVETPREWHVAGDYADRWGTCGWCHAPILLRAGYPRRFCGAACGAAWHALDWARQEARAEWEGYVWRHRARARMPLGWAA